MQIKKTKTYLISYSRINRSDSSKYSTSQEQNLEELQKTILAILINYQSVANMLKSSLRISLIT